MQVDQRHPSVLRKSSLSLQAALPDGMTGNNFESIDLCFIVPIPVGFSVSSRFWGACIRTLQPLNSAFFLISMSRKHFFGAADEIELKYVNRYASLALNNCLIPT